VTTQSPADHKFLASLESAELARMADAAHLLADAMRESGRPVGDETVGAFAWAAVWLGAYFESTDPCNPAPDLLMALADGLAGALS
jgi:hypothetical protein